MTVLAPVANAPNVSPWTAFGEMERRFNEMLSEMFERPRSASPGAFPPVNIWMNVEAAVVTAEMPGVASSSLEVSAMRNVLTISGERAASETPAEAQWRRRERPMGRFTRTVQLPFEMDADQVTASFADGVLEVRAPRPASERPRRIAVKAG